MGIEKNKLFGSYVKFFIWDISFGNIVIRKEMFLNSYFL